MAAAIQRSFAGGELSQSLGARADLVKYQTGTALQRNAVTCPDGGVANRPGSYFVAKTKLLEIGVGLYAYAPVRLIEWQFNTADQSYILEMGPEYIRFHQNGAPVRVSSVAAWSAVTAYEAGDLVSRLSVNYYCVADNTNEQPPNVAYWYALEDDIFEVPTEFSAEDVEELQYSQQGDLMSFVHKDHRPSDLVRTAHTGWVLTSATLFGAINYYWMTAVPAPTGITHNKTIGAGITYMIAAVTEDGEEGNSGGIGSSDLPSSGAPTIISWNAVTGAFGYNIYRIDGNGLGLLGFTVATQFYDYAALTDLSDLPRVARPEFTTDPIIFTGFPSVIANFQQRRFVANLYPYLYDVWGSRVGVQTNFDKKRPALADSSLRFQVMGRYVSEVRHIVDLGVLMVFTAEGEAVIKGDANGVVRPGEAHPDFKSYNGASKLRPLVVGSAALYVQDSGSSIRSAGFDIAAGGRDGYIDSDLSAMASHLIKGKTIVSWAYQKAPYSIAMMARNDGLALGMTIVREHQIQAWHRHDTDGLYKGFAAVKESGKDALYQVVQREVDGETIQFIERQAPREFTDVRDMMFLDCALAYDGRNTDDEHTMRLEGADFGAGKILALHSTEDFLTAEDVGNVIQVYGVNDAGDDYRIDCKILEVTSGYLASVRVSREVPDAMQSLEISDWARAVNVVSGLEHLEGEAVGIMGDGDVIACPLHPKYPEFTVEDAEVDLGERYCGVIYVGLSYVSDIQSLDLEVVNGTIAHKHQLVSEVTVFLEDTRGLYAGTNLPRGSDLLKNLQEMKPEDVGYAGVPLVTGKVKIPVPASWTKNGRVVLRQVLPLPFKVNAIVPTGFIAGGN